SSTRSRCVSAVSAQFGSDASLFGGGETAPRSLEDGAALACAIAVLLRTGDLQHAQTAQAPQNWPAVCQRHTRYCGDFILARERERSDAQGALAGALPLWPSKPSQNGRAAFSSDSSVEVGRRPPPTPPSSSQLGKLSNILFPTSSCGPGDAVHDPSHTKDFAAPRTSSQTLTLRTSCPSSADPPPASCDLRPILAPTCALIARCRNFHSLAIRRGERYIRREVGRLEGRARCSSFPSFDRLALPLDRPPLL
ncbi:hypothetical protein K523DRAFT_382607, partial [Schizophyllum commune Tattone D]